jgi:hypothetical protein
LFSSVLVPEERREIICTEDRKDHEEETAGASVEENQTSFISYLLRDGRTGNMAEIQVDAFGLG